ncbi:MAG: glycoside hydrolase family 2 TIM barrel-domain containing protein, partial [Anaerolineae bacterium]
RENAELGLWRVPVETTLYNAGAQAETATVVSTIEAPDGRIVAQAESLAEVPPRAHSVVQQSMNVRHPQLWSLEQPALYTLRTLVLRDGVPVDDQETRFGFRTLEYTADRGFLLNDVPTRLKGTCNHQDHAGVGVALPDRIHAYRIQRLLAMGSNAYRCAHNPPAPELLDACDALGMLVMDETRWFSSSAEGLAQLETMVRRDRNHPSVILWSVFNEEPLQGSEAGRRTAETMVARVHALDDSRAVTGAMDHGWLERNADGVPCSAAAALDVIGINYNLHQYDAVRALFPDKPIVGSESAAASTSRGMYTRDGGYIPAYDHQEYGFGSSVRDAWRAADRPDVMGTFLWTGIEYRGEERWPAVHSQSGMLDTCCQPKDNAWLCRVLWAADPAIVHILPHWNWSGHEGEVIDVRVYSNCETVELYFNGQSLGEQAVDPYEPPRWGIAYERGVLQALGKRGGAVVAQDFSETTGGPAALQLAPGVPLLRADGEDACPVEVSTLDVDGTLVPTSSDLVRFSLKGDGVILGVGNGDAMSHEADAASQRHLFNGKCQVIVQAGLMAGELTLIAEADGLAPASLRIPMAAVDRRPHVPEAELVWRLERWWMSGVSREPIPLQSLERLMEVSALTQVRLGPEGITLDEAGHAVLGTMSHVPEGRRAGLALSLAGIRGAAEIVVLPTAGRQPDLTRMTAAGKVDQGEAPFTVDLSALPDDVTEVAIVVLLHADSPGGGLTGEVRWEIGHETGIGR